MRRALALVAALGSACYLATLVLVPLVDRARDAMRSYPEDYTDGPAGSLLALGYLLGGISDLALGLAVLARGSRVSRAGALGLIAGGVLSLALVPGPFMVTGGILAVFAVALFAAPLVVSVGYRGSGRRWFVALGAVVALGLVLMGGAPAATRGLANRLVDAALGAWTLGFALLGCAAGRTDAPSPGVGYPAAGA